MKKDDAKRLFGKFTTTKEEQEDEELMNEIIREEEQREKAAKAQGGGFLRKNSESDEEELMKELLLKEGKPISSQVAFKKDDTESMNDLLGIIGERTEDVSSEDNIAESYVDELDVIDEKKTKDPLLLLQKYISKTRLRSSQKLSLHLTNPSEPVNASRITLSRKISIGDFDKALGKPACLTTYGTLIIVGYSQGVIKLVDSTDSSTKFLNHKDVYGKRVAALEVNKAGTHLIAGYENGALTLWDLMKFSLLKLATSIHNSPVLSVRFIKGPKLVTVSSDLLGDVYVTEFSKSMFGMSANTTLLCKLKCASSVAPAENSTVAIAGITGVVVATVEPSVRILWEYKGELASKEALPYVDWGRGAVPGNLENESSVLAIAWEKVVQLIVVKDITQPNEGYAYNGYYISEDSIDGVWWLSEGILAVLNSKRELQVLYTGYFATGKFQEGISKRPKVHPAEVEPPHHVGEYPVATPVRYGKTTLGQTEWTSYHQSFSVKERTLFCLGQAAVVCWKLYSWVEFIEEERRKGHWLNALRVSLRLYSGKIKGFADLPEQRILKEATLRAVLKNYLREYLLQAAERDRKDSTLAPLAIEFCVGVSAVDYLFEDMLRFFAGIQQETIYVEALEAFILSGKFVSVEVPQGLIKVIVDYYVGKKKIETLEKLLLNFNLVGQDLGYLSELCLKHKLFLLYIYVKTAGNTEQNYVDPLVILLNEMKAREGKTDYPISKLFEVGKEAETGAKYICYVMLHYIDLCLKRKKFPKRFREEERTIPVHIWGNVVFLVLNWLFSPSSKNGSYNIRHLAMVDLGYIFTILKQLFENSELKQILLDLPKYSELLGSSASIRSYTDILTGLEKTMSELEPKIIEGPIHAAYSKFLAQIASCPRISVSSEACVEAARRLSGCTQELDGSAIDRKEYEHLILSMLKNCKELTREQVDTLIAAFSSKAYTEVLIYLREIKGEYTKCFETYLAARDPVISSKIFPWLESVHEKLDESGEYYKSLRSAIYDKLEILVNLQNYKKKQLVLNMKKAAEVVDTWLKHQHEEVISKLAKQPKLQREYVQRVLNDKAEDIDRTFPHISLQQAS
eukprot:TRINITY_DN74_c0_g2_i1.p1 TRINITY_DN74_c0_g2~~TRINITY_DN74_c0_g2_i1.p1  ORF type:complete len:1082 (-),score=121.24 TRINITY_DN74_c0_g2_i1:4787-8032(-)